MKKVRNANRITSIILILAMTFVMVFGSGMTTFAARKPITVKSGNNEFIKISNPTHGSMEPDGINTNDPDFDANRLNSYAWAVVSRGHYIYVGTNRTLFGSALNATAEIIKQGAPDTKLTDEVLGKIVNVLSGCQVPVLLPDEAYVPQIIRFDIYDGSSKVLYTPETAVGEDGRRYYLDKDGCIVDAADVASETLSFRSAIEYKGNLYFGTLGVNMLRLVRIDENDNYDIPFETIGSYSSLRACAIHEIEEGKDTIFFGGQDADNETWLKYKEDNPGEPAPLPIVIRYLDPETAGGKEDWDGLIADFRDFGEYAYASVYVTGGGNVWDLCSYNGNLYLILAYDEGWAMFRGENGGGNPNQYGWTWTEIVGNNGEYPLAMNEEVGELNKQFEKAYGCSEYGASLTGSGLLESTATPYVYKGKMYIGTFDNATSLQAQTVIKALVKLSCLQNAKETGIYGPSLTQMFAPIYEALTHQQHIWVMDEDENIEPVEDANELMKGTTVDYVWRFIDYDDKLYVGTFDSASVYNYFVDFTMDRLVSALKANKEMLPDYLQQLLDGRFSRMLRRAFRQAGLELQADADEKTQKALDNLEDAAVKASADVEAVLAGSKDIDELLDSMEALEDAEDDFGKATKPSGLALYSDDENKLIALTNKVRDMIEFLDNLIDVEGLEYMAKARKIIRKADAGFDLLRYDEESDKWEKLVDNGLNDRFNYGARTFTICADQLFLGTANPYYGAQLWKIAPDLPESAKVVKKPRKTYPIYNGEAQELVKPGVAEGGEILYRISSINGEKQPEEGYSPEIPTATDAGKYTVEWFVYGDEDHQSADGGRIRVKILKASNNIKVENASKTFKAERLEKRGRRFNIKASASSGGDLDYKVMSYSSRAAKKYLAFNTERGTVRVRKGTPKGIYRVRVRISSKATDNYFSAYKIKTIKVRVE